MRTVLKVAIVGALFFVSTFFYAIDGDVKRFKENALIFSGNANPELSLKRLQNIWTFP